jgi:hypothetical protein
MSSRDRIRSSIRTPTSCSNIIINIRMVLLNFTRLDNDSFEYLTLPYVNVVLRLLLHLHEVIQDVICFRGLYVLEFVEKVFGGLNVLHLLLVFLALVSITDFYRS